MRIKYILLGMISTIVMIHSVETGEILPPVMLDKNNLTKKWYSKNMKGKVHLVLYMDPDKRQEAMPFLDKINSMNFDTKYYATVAIVNLDATWMPDSLLKSMLSTKEKSMKNIQFLFDKKKYLVEKWKLKDNASNILICDKKGNLVYKKSGKLSKKEIAKIIDIIKKKIQENQR